MKLIIGNKNYSSWSLRAWLMLSAFDVPFEEVRIALSRPDTAAQIARYNKAGKVPVLLDGDLLVWDSLAICEYVSERYLDGRGWPAGLEARAVARSCTAEMHSGLFELRRQMPMNCRALNRRIDFEPALHREIQRVDELWTTLRGKADGPWLFGDFSIADCMFAPVVFRFNTYNAPVTKVSREYMAHVLQHDKVQLWLEQARQEKEIIEQEEVGL